VIYDTSEMGGTLLCTLLRHQQIISFNSQKQGTIKIFDIRQQQIMETIQLINEEITAVELSKDQATLITGSKDGIVKIWDAHNNFALREQIEAFIDPVTHKKHEVS
jgi:WD40 repeat protein